MIRLIFFFDICFLIMCLITHGRCFNLQYVEQNPDMGNIYCGNQISDAIAAVCEGWYAASSMRKRSIDPGPSDGTNQLTEGNEDELIYPFRSKLSIRRFMIRVRRDVKYGIYNECCQKPCSYKELLTYCGDKS